MGTFLSTQLDWERRRGSWRLAVNRSNDNALYLMYVELCEVYLRWFRQQDLDFHTNNDPRSEEAVLLKTPFRRPLVFQSTVPLARLTGDKGSQKRLNSIEAQRYRHTAVQQRLLEMDDERKAGMHFKPAHRRRPRWKNDGSLPYDIDPELPALVLPDYFWTEYCIDDGEATLTSRAVMDARLIENEVVLMRRRPQRQGGEPIYSMCEPEQGQFRCVVWDMKHLLEHLALLVTVLDPSLQDSITTADQAVSLVSTPFALEAVRQGAFRCYLLLDTDYAACPSGPSQELFNALLLELRSMVESLANDSAGDQVGGGAEARVAAAWRSIFVGDIGDQADGSVPPGGEHLETPMAQPGDTAELMRQAAGERVNRIPALDAAADPARYSATVPVRLLNSLLSDAAAVRRDAPVGYMEFSQQGGSEVSAHPGTAANKHKSHSIKSGHPNRPRQGEHARDDASDGDAASSATHATRELSTLMVPAAGQQQWSTVTHQRSPRVTASNRPSPVYETASGFGDKASGAGASVTLGLAHERVSAEHRSDLGGSMAGTERPTSDEGLYEKQMTAMSISEPTSSPRQRNRVANINAALQGDLQELTPAEICAEMYSKMQLEEMEVDDSPSLHAARRRDRRRAEDRAKQAENEARHQQHQFSAEERHNIIASELERVDEKGAEEALIAEDQQRERIKAEKRAEQERRFEEECEAVNKDEDLGFGRVPAPPAHRKKPPAVSPRMPVVGRGVVRGLAYRLQAVAPRGFPLAPDYGRGKVAADRPGGVQRLAFALLWQQFELLILSSIAARAKHQQFAAPLTASSVEQELADITRLCGQESEVFPARAARWVTRPAVMPPWRAAAGDLGEAEVWLHKDGDADRQEDFGGEMLVLQVLATNAGWYAAAGRNNQEARLMSSAYRREASGLDQGQPVGPTYPTLVLLLREHSAHWRSFDAERLRTAAAAQPKRPRSQSPNKGWFKTGTPQEYDIQTPATQQPRRGRRKSSMRRSSRGPSMVMSSGAGRSPVSAPIQVPQTWGGRMLRHGSISPSPLSADALGLNVGEVGTAPSTRSPAGVAHSETTTPGRHPPPDSATIRAAFQARKRTDQMTAAASERRRREEVKSLRRRQRALAASIARDDDFEASGALSDVSSLDGSTSIMNLPPQGLDILRDGPTPVKSRSPNKSRAFDMRSQSIRSRSVCSEDMLSRSGSPFSSPGSPGGTRIPMGAVDWQSGDETDDSQTRQNSSSLVRRHALTVRDWTSLSDPIEFSRTATADMMALGDLRHDIIDTTAAKPTKEEEETLADDGLGFLALPTQPKAVDLKQRSSKVQYQWIAFLRKAANVGQTLFALRSLTDADLSLPANQFMVLRFSGHCALAQILAGSRDVRLRTDAGKALLTMAQNTAAAKELSHPRSGVLVAAARCLHEYSTVPMEPAHIPARPSPSSSPGFSPQGVMKSGQLSRMAVDALQGKKGQGGQQAQGKGAKETLLAVVGFLLASCALTCGRAREQLRALGVDGYAVALLARFDGKGGEQLPIAMAHLLRSLILRKDYEMRKAAKEVAHSGAAVQPVEYIVGVVPAIARQLTGPCSPLWIAGETYARLRTHQALAGLVCAFRRSHRYCDDAAAHHIALPIMAAQRDILALVRQARLSVVNRVHEALRGVQIQELELSTPRASQQQDAAAGLPAAIARHIQKKPVKTPEHLVEMTQVLPPLITPESPAGLLGCCRVLVITWHALETLAWHPIASQQLIPAVPEALELLIMLTRPIQIRPGGKERQGSWAHARGVEDGTNGIPALPCLKPAPGNERFRPVAEDGDVADELEPVPSFCRTTSGRAGVGLVAASTAARTQITLLLISHVTGFLAECCRHTGHPAKGVVGASLGAISMLGRLLLIDHIVLGRGVAPRGHWGEAQPPPEPLRVEEGDSRTDRLLARIKDQAAALIARLSAHSQSRAAVADLVLPSILFELRRGGLGTTAAQLCHSLTSLGAGKPEVRRRLSARSTVLTLWTLLMAFDWDVREAAAQTISTLVAPPVPKQRGQRGKVNEPDTVSAAILSIIGDEVGVLPKLLEVPPHKPRMAAEGRAEQGYIPVQCAVCRLITTVCSRAPPELVAIVFSCKSLVPSVVQLLDRTPRGIELEAVQRVRAAAASCLCLAAKQLGPEPLIRHGAVAKVGLHLGRESGKAATECDLQNCLMLKELCSASPEACAAVIDAGMVSALVRLLGSPEPVLQDAAASTIGSVRHHHVTQAGREQRGRLHFGGTDVA
eukprot:Hpha_TRINITY_DN22291_c0_g1::TRINITY_DN22291_c0_g1_i1::g.167113::m.167113